MKPPRESEALEQVVERLEALLSLGPARIRDRSPRAEVDLMVDLDGHMFVVEWKHSGAAAPVQMAIDQVFHAADSCLPDAIPIIAVPYMGSVGRVRCERAEVNWLDLSGNALISAPGIRVRIEGQPNRFKRRGRPSSPFAPKASRIARWLLMHPDRWTTQRDMAQATLMDEGYTSRVVSRLEEEGLVVRNPEGAVGPRDPDLLLDAWREDYDFGKHEIRRGHIPARSGEDLLRRMAEMLRLEDVEYAATALPAAWLLTGFAGFRLVTIYATGRPQDDLAGLLSLSEDDRGANVWLVAPSDEGVFHGANEHNGVRCVHPVQAYLDLLGHPERAEAAADELRAMLLDWRGDDT